MPVLAETSSRAILARGEGALSWEAPVRVVAGHGTLAHLGRLIAPLGESALVVTDANLLRHVIVRESLSRLAQHGVRTAIFADVPPHPTLQTVRDVATVGKEARSRMVVGIGGGSPMDVAKVAAAALRNPQLLSDDQPLWAGAAGVVMPADDWLKRGLPLVQIPTTVGTGSEVNVAASLVSGCGTRKKLLLHPGLRARLAILDSDATRSLPGHLVAEGGLEIMTRLLIPYLTDRTPNRLSDVLTEALVGLVMETTSRVLDAPDDAEARLTLALAGVNSHIGFSTTGRPQTGHVLWYLANAIGPRFGVRKMEGMSGLLREYLRRVVEGDARLGRADRLARLGSRSLGVVERSPASTAAVLTSLMAQWRLPMSLGQVGVAPSDVESLTRLTFSQWGGLDGALAGLSEEELTSFYTASL